MSKITELPERIIQRNAEVHLLRDILPHFDPDSFDKATTKYRKPSYQRDLSKSTSWNKALINSILQGKAIGGIVMSKWSKSVNGEVDTYYNIEDGGTRLGTCKKFFLGEFESDYGGIDQAEIKDRFLNYKVAVEILDKAHIRKKNSAYFEELCHNFSLLQEGTPLTASDRYAANVSDSEFNFGGSPIVNYTIKEISEDESYKTYFGLFDVTPRGVNRKKLASSVALISGMVLGPKFANTQYFLHVPIMYKLISKPSKTKFQIVKNLIMNTIKNIELGLPPWMYERFTSYFYNCTKFIGSMIADIYDKYPNKIEVNNMFKLYSQVFTKRWTKVINQWRQIIQEKDRSKADEWLEAVVYCDLDTANKRNSLEENLRQRMFAVRKFVNKL